MTNSENNKRIAKNTAMLYVRMLIIMAVSLYTSRVVLQTLGVIDFGIYNVVGGVVTMMAFFNSSLATATQRFLNVEMGKGNLENLKKVFSMSFICFCLIALLVVIVAETVGLWFVYNKLVIPEDRMASALVIYHISIATFLINILLVPYNAAIIANEKMKAYAYVSVIDVVLRLALVYLLSVLSFDKLEMYGILMMAVALIIAFMYWIYCINKFSECKLEWIWDARLLKSLFSFSGWMLFGTVTNMLSTQGVNMLINIYFGPALNAARAISMQVYGAISSFSSNFLMATKPQIVKSYSMNELDYTYKLVFSSSKLSFYFLFVLSLPILLNAEYILALWLRDVPVYVPLFTRLVILDLLITSSYNPIAFVSQASGKIRNYQLIISVGFMSIFILSWLMFKWGFPVYSTFVVSVIISLLGLFARLVELRKSVCFPMSDYLRQVLSPLALVSTLSFILTFIVEYFIPIDSIWLLIVNTIIYFSITVIIIWIIGLNKSEMLMAKSVINKIKIL